LTAWLQDVDVVNIRFVAGCDFPDFTAIIWRLATSVANISFSAQIRNLSALRFWNALPNSDYL
jgi:hypothetical protein